MIHYWRKEHSFRSRSKLWLPLPCDSSRSWSQPRSITLWEKVVLGVTATFKMCGHSPKGPWVMSETTGNDGGKCTLSMLIETDPFKLIPTSHAQQTDLPDFSMKNNVRGQKTQPQEILWLLKIMCLGSSAGQKSSSTFWWPFGSEVW